MTLSENGLNFIKAHEGLRLVAYNDGAGTFTIGYGHIQGITQGMIITQQDANNFLLQDTATALKCLNRNNFDLNQNQADALIDFIFNEGCANFTKSHLFLFLKNGLYIQAANELDKWIFAGGKVLPGLVKRRADEKKLFLTQ